MTEARAPTIRIFAIFAAGYFLSYSFRSIGPIIAPDIAAELRLNPRELGALASVYFLTFFLAQPVIGIAMDRFGPGRVNSVLIGIAAAGAALFASGEGIVTLTIGRALIGLGVAGALVTAFKAFVVWYAPRHREALSGGMMAVGGLAAMATASPAELLMREIGWRGLFWVLCAAALLVAITLAVAVPQVPAPADDGDATRGGYRSIFGSRIFLSYAPLAIFGSGGFSAIQSLWAGPWLIEVAGLTRAGAAQVLLAYGLSLLVGYLMVAAIGARIAATRHGPRRWFIGSLTVAYAALGVIVANPFPDSSLPWFAYGMTLGAAMLAYPALTRAFPAAIAGRVVTAYNLLMFIGAFALQFGIGAVIQALLDTGISKVAAYQGAFGSLLAIQVLALIWFAVLSRAPVAHPAPSIRNTTP